MLKRPREADAASEHLRKRKRQDATDRLSRLSDELLLTILHNVSVSTLALCQRLSHRFHTLAGDSQLWKAAYYSRFVLPRASRIPGVKDQSSTLKHLVFSSRVSKWLDEDSLVRRGAQTNWKRQYKLRHNWSRGSCDVSEIKVAEERPIPPLLVQLHAGLVITVDAAAELRAWSMSNAKKLLAQTQIHDGKHTASNEYPTSLAVDLQGSEGGDLEVAVGFNNGRFSVFRFMSQNGSFIHRFTHPSSSSGALSAIAYSRPYLVTMTKAQLLSLYTFPEHPESDDQSGYLDAPRLLSSLKSHTIWPPYSISIRVSKRSLVASIAYALPIYLSGWSVGVQELWLTPEGEMLESRLASAVSQGFQPLSTVSSPPASPSAETIISPSRKSERSSGHSVTKPTSLSYTHPYLLASHPDNTLTLYMVTSTSSMLSISAGSRLWGHTSSVSGAHVDGRGKAVSISSRGDELRIWELEGGISASTSRRRAALGEASVRVQPDHRPFTGEHNEVINSKQLPVTDGQISSIPRESQAEVTVTRGWLGFDEEKVIVLKEKGMGTQALVIYDFT
ncbi:MAG: hypothetical protein M1835_007988 [Candelina submexicana]|nr:MAG: hypothetical protein M1835_007988 [Candelina submexicana]